MTQRFAGFRLVFAVVALALWAGDAANAQVERTPTAKNVVRNVKRTPSLDANPVVAPRRVSEETTAGSRSANDSARVAARVGSADVTGGRNSGFGRNEGWDFCLQDVNSLVCCLTGCESKFDECQAIAYSCPTVVPPVVPPATPFLCLLEFKCCVLNKCINCKPKECSGCAEDCNSLGLVCCDATNTCYNPDTECCTDDPSTECCTGADCTDGSATDGSATACCEATNTCYDPDTECCDCNSPNNLCCDDGKCIDTSLDQCCVNSDCDLLEYCCINSCISEDLCCDGFETCYAKADALDCCWIPVDKGGQGPCGSNPPKSFNKWGWTNGPYDLTGGSFADQSLDVWCGAGKCDITKTTAFPRGKFEFTWQLSTSTFTAQWSPGGQMPPETVWQLHLGCGSGGVYAKKDDGTGAFTDAPGQYEFRGTGSEKFELQGVDFEFSNCSEFYVIAHFCAGKD